MVIALALVRLSQQVAMFPLKGDGVPRPFLSLLHKQTDIHCSSDPNKNCSESASAHLDFKLTVLQAPRYNFTLCAPDKSPSFHLSWVKH